MIIKICGIMIICLAATLISKSTYSSYGYIIPVAALVCTLLAVALPLFRQLTDLFSAYESLAISQYVTVLAKSMGISILSAITAEICISCKEELLSNLTIFTGKAEIIVLCIPLIKNIIQISGEML